MKGILLLHLGRWKLTKKLNKQYIISDAGPPEDTRSFYDPNTNEFSDCCSILSQEELDDIISNLEIDDYHMTDVAVYEVTFKKIGRIEVPANKPRFIKEK